MSWVETGPRCSTQTTEEHLARDLILSESSSTSQRDTVIQEVIPQNDNPQRICPRKWKTQAEDNRQGAGRGLIKQKRMQFSKAGTGQAGGEQTRSKPQNQAEKQCWKVRHEHNTVWQRERDRQGFKQVCRIVLTSREKIEIN